MTFFEKVTEYAKEKNIDDGLIWDKSENCLCINCNDVFWWGVGDDEPIINNEDLELLKLSMEEDSETGMLLYCCRRRKMRPQGAFYKFISKDVWYLFNQCGEEREVGLGNPYSIGEGEEE